MVPDPMVAELEKRFVEEAVVEKSDVDVAPVAVMFWKALVAVNVLAPENVLELARSVVETPRAGRVDS